MENLSHLCDGVLGVKVGSMQATNDVSVTPDFGAPGSDNEAVDDVDVHDAPENVPAADDSARQLVDGRASSPSPIIRGAWNDVASAPTAKRRFRQGEWNDLR